MKFEKDNDLVS